MASGAILDRSEGIESLVAKLEGAPPADWEGLASELLSLLPVECLEREIKLVRKIELARFYSEVQEHLRGMTFSFTDEGKGLGGLDRIKDQMSREPNFPHEGLVNAVVRAWEDFQKVCGGEASEEEQKEYSKILMDGIKRLHGGLSLFLEDKRYLERVKGFVERSETIPVPLKNYLQRLVARAIHQPETVQSLVARMVDQPELLEGFLQYAAAQSNRGSLAEEPSGSFIFSAGAGAGAFHGNDAGCMK